MVRCYYHSHITDERTETRKGEVICPGRPGESELGLEPGRSRWGPRAFNHGASSQVGKQEEVGAGASPSLRSCLHDQIPKQGAATAPQLGDGVVGGSR